MSAFICEADTIGTLAREIALWKRKPEEAEETAELLADLNLKSVAYRYHMSKRDACKEFTGHGVSFFVSQCRVVAGKKDYEEVTPWRLWGMASGFLYQACEHPRAEEDVAYKTVEAFQALMKAESEAAGKEREGWA